MSNATAIFLLHYNCNYFKNSHRCVFWLLLSLLFHIYLEHILLISFPPLEKISSKADWWQSASRLLWGLGMGRRAFHIGKTSLKLIFFFNVRRQRWSLAKEFKLQYLNLTCTLSVFPTHAFKGASKHDIFFLQSLLRRRALWCMLRHGAVGGGICKDS